MTTTSTSKLSTASPPPICCICYDIYDNEYARAFTASCGHSLCAQCEFKLRSSCIKNGIQSKCCICMKPFEGPLYRTYALESPTPRNELPKFFNPYMSDDEIRIDLFINPRLYEVASIEDDDPPNSPTVSDEYPPSPVRSPIIEDHPVRSPILLSSQYLGNPSIAGNNSQFQQAQTHIQFNQQQYIFPIVPNFFQTPVGGVPQVHPFYVDPQSQGIAPYYYGFLPAIWPRNNQIPNEPPQRPPRNGSNPP